MLDVDGAQMQRVSTSPGQNPSGAETGGDQGEETPAGEESDPYADDPAAADSADPEPDPLADVDENPDVLTAAAEHRVRELEQGVTAPGQARVEVLPEV
ncbi:hypothetical protein N4P33_02810 [Streptomyces sp. 15-116A]|uniref:hypothetical protein n=1 Tax=Streptomyces sp. 15-116A TaxID=2259035 RepID=UPI0021B2C43B|nr:hypothetical protein [Streptomyces sp. 15-116A]MCT7351106.1 hypothetical protein [Streptomyces sp. 15-116A]